MAERSEFDRFFDKLEAADPQFQEIAALRAQVSALQTEAKHWKDQHANEVKRARILKETTDLPLERVRAYDLTGELQGQVEKLKEQLESADAGWIAWQEKHGEELLKREAVELERDQLRAEVERLEKEAVDRLAWQERYYEERLRLKQEAAEKGAESMRERVEARLNNLVRHIGIHAELSTIAVEDNAFQEAASDVEVALADIRALPLKENEG